MEIHSLRYTGSLFHKNTGKNPKEQPDYSDTPPTVSQGLFAEQLDKTDGDQSQMTPRELRERALGSFDAGLIDIQTYRQLAADLPMEAVDVQGRVIDLSSITDETPFDFGVYYRNQLTIAETLGDDEGAELLKSVVAFLET